MPKFTLQFLLWCAFCFISLPVNGQVTAGFTTDDTAGCAPLVVHFTNTSAGATSYSWNLGDGSALLTVTDVSKAYTSIGTYTVTLTAYNGTDSSTYSTVIRVYSIPTVNFSAADTSVCPGTPVTFSSTSTAGSWGAITYTWNFGDGSSSTLNAPAHSYPTPGYYNITLYATNAKGCVNSLARDAYIHIYTPAAIAFTAPTLFCRPTAVVAFTNTTTGTGPMSYTWKYGDGGSGTSTSPTHSYTTAGNFTVSLKVTDGHGCTDSLVKPAYVNVGTLSVGFTSSPAMVCIGFPITFTNTSASYISSNWSFGDGGTSTATNPLHSYTASGTYTVQLVAYNGGTCYDTITHTVTVSPSPTGSFTITPAEPCPPPVPLTLTATMPAGCTASWLFGDSTMGSGTPVTHTYHRPRITSIDLIVTNSSGCRDTVLKLDTTYSLYLNASTSSPTSGCAPLTVNFSSYNYSVVGDSFLHDSLYISYPYPITGYSWSFGDGSAPSTSITPTHIYTAAGTYNATCTITTANGCSASGSVTIYVGVPPHASFTMSPTHECAGKTTTFTSTSTGTIDNYAWNFGDGDGAGGPFDAVYVYEDTVPGIHTVYLTVYDNFCPSIPFSLTDTTYAPWSEINYSYTCIPKDGINFTDVSTGDNTHTWIFGDGTTSTLANPVHYFPALTVYPVELATYNSTSGCMDTATMNINLSGPYMSVTGDSLNICQYETEKLVSTIIGSIPVLGYRWYDNSVLIDSVDANLNYMFHTLGLHTISLVIEDNRYCLDTLTRTAYIDVARPTDNYSFTPGVGCAPLAVHFSDLSTDVPGAPIKAYFWSFGDGDTTTISLASISHTYTASGTYSVEEIVTDTFGCKDTLVTSTLAINKPTASFSTATSNVCANATVSFTNTSTGYTSSSWSFGDGATSTAPSPSHVYTASGVYTVQLIVHSSLSCADTLTMSSYITVNPTPAASFYMNDSFAICPPLNVSFTNTSTGATSYYWNLGDGTSSYTSAAADIYVSSAIYTIKLAATNAYGCSDTAIGHASIFGYAGAFSYSPTTGCSPLSVHFSTVLTSASSIIWDFDDGTTALSPSDTTNHTYVAAGEYIPKLILRDTTGCTSFSLGIDTIKVDTVIASFIATPDPACQGAPITFVNTSVSYFSTIASQTWTFAPGITSRAASPVYSYSVSASYPVTLSAKDALGCTSTVTENVTVTPPPPAISGALSLCAGSTSALTDPGGTWSVTGPGVATIGSTTGIVSGIAHGTATVTFTSSSGCAITALLTINPSPGAISGVSGICQGSTATFSDTTLGGFWSSGNTLVATVGSSSGIVTGLSTGTATISYSFGGSCGITKVVSVNASPTPISGPSVICEGTTALETDGITGGTWTSSNTAIGTIGSSGGTITGIAPGTTTIVYSAGAGCNTIEFITVNATPVLISGTGTVCQGMTTHLTDATTGGSWSSQVTSIATVNSTGTVTGVSPGSDTISYSIGSCSATFPVTVYATPSSISGPTAVCAGASITLHDAVTGGTWTSSNTAVATIGTSSGFVAGIFPATATATTIITYSLGGGCTATTTVTINPLAPITGITALCAGLTSSLSDAVTGGTWGSGTTSVGSIASTGLLTTSLPGNTTVTYSLPTGCVATSIVTVNLAPSPITGMLNVCLGSTASLIDGGGGSWSTGSASIATVGSTGVVTGVAIGATSVTYSLGSGCTTTNTITVNPLPSIPSGATFSLCAGSSITLTDGTTGGTWSDGGPTAIATVTPSSGIVSGVSAGTAIITYSITATGCSAYRTITVNPLPLSISGTLSLCTGTSGSLTDLTSGGTWSSSNTAIATIGSGSGTIGGVLAGTTAITYTLPATGCTSATTVSVTTFPAVITGTGAVCLGSSASLSDATSGGTWSSTGTTISIGTLSGSVSGLSLGTAAVTYSLGGACIAYKTVTVNPLPSIITGPGRLCTSSLITLSDATTGGTWTSSNTVVAIVDTNSGTVSGLFAGTTTIVYTSPPGCVATTVITVIAGIPPITGLMHVCNGLTATLSDVATGGAWSSGDSSVAVVFGGLVTSVSPGTATISYITSGCPATVVFTVNPLPGPIIGGPAICLRLPSPFADSAAGGTWSTPITSVATVNTGTGVVTGLVTGHATLIYTLPTGCTASTSITIDTVPPGIMGVTHLCVGQTATLTDTLPGGVWSSNGPGIASVVPIGPGTSAVVSGLSDGVANISYTQGGCPAIATVVVNPLPGPILGLSAMCAYGSLLPVYDSTPGGTWTSALAIVSPDGVLTSYAAGIATVTYTLGTACRTIDTFTVNPLPGPITGATRVCTGLTTILADTASGGLWTSSNTAVAHIETGLLNALLPGTTTITYTLPLTGCNETLTITVYAHPSPIAGPSNVCEGAMSILTDTVGGGAWVSSNPALASADAVSGTVTGISPGSATITYTVAAGCAATRTVTVLPLPAAHLVTGGGSYCAGGSGVYIGLSGSATGINYDLYLGTSSVDTIAGTGSAIDFGLDTAGGIYTVLAVNAATGCSSSMTGSATIVITPVVFPSLSILAVPNDTVCAGTPVLFAAITAFGGVSPVYHWSVNGLATGVDTPYYSYTPANNDSVNVLFISSTACAVPDTLNSFVIVTVDSAQTLLVNITSSPGVSVLSGAYDTLTANVTNGASLTYQWVINGVPIPGATSATFVSDTFSNEDSVSCIVNSNGICDIAGYGSTTITISNVGVKPLTNGGNISILPNPNNGTFTIKGSIESPTDEEVTLEITDMLGQVVYQGKLTAHNGKINQQVRLSGSLANGVYLLALKSGNGSEVFHMVLEQ